MLFAACASQNAAKGKAAGANKRISDIITSENAKSTTVTVKGNQVLTYTAIKQVFPLGVLIDLPETSLDNIKTVYYPPENDFISSIRATQIEQDGKTSRIFIALKKDLPYAIEPNAAGLNIVISKSGKMTAKMQPKAPRAEKGAPVPAKAPAAPATRLTSVSATPHQQNVMITIEADGTITNFKSFTISETPPRIVYDIYNLKSPFKGEQRIAVKSGQVRKIRHFGHPDKIRIVLETNKAYLSKHTARPVDNGMLIYVGQAPPPASQKNPKATKSRPASAPGRAGVEKLPSAKYDQPAWLNRIEFTSEEAGKSAIIIGTTRPVEHRMIKVDKKRLHLQLLSTNLPEYRKRALITTRFQSAVDRITPTFLPESKDTVIDIELREGVPFIVKQTDDVIRVNFAASRIPPRPYEDAKLPAWKKVLAEPTAAAAKIPPAAAGQITMVAAPVKTTKKDVEPGEAEKATLSGKSPSESGEVIYTEIEPERYDMEHQKRKNLQTGGEKQVDIYGEQVAKKYTGEPIALDFYETDIKNVFRILKEISGKNFAVDKGVTGKVTLALEQPVPWDQVLDLVLKMNQLGRKMEGDIIRISTLATLAAEEKLRQAKLKETQKAKHQEDLVTAFIRVNYADAGEMVRTQFPIPSSKEKNSVLTTRATISVDPRLNMITLTDVPSAIKRVKEIIQRLDLVTPQVVIEARIVEANTNFTRDLGFNWGTVSAGPFDVGNSQLLLSGLANNLPLVNPSGVVGFDFQKLTGTPFSIIDASLLVSETEGKTNIISAPKIVTLNNRKAKIKQGLEVPYQERDSSGNSTIKFKNVDLLLEVTPTVTPDNRIGMKIFVTKNDVAEQTDDGPALSTNEAETELLIDNGDTIVIGGIVKSSIVYGEKGIPGLRKIGVLGWLFKGQSKSDTKNELLIFITPRIVQLQQKGSKMDI